MTNSPSFSIRKAADRGHANLGWLDTWHTFSFSTYHDRNHMRFRALRVINEDRVDPGEGFGTHPHKDMEIVTYVLSGALEHRDSMGNGSILKPGEFQRMSAGTGITHSEFNPSSTEQVHLYQIWLLPERPGIEPSYEQKEFPVGNEFRLVASRDAREGSLLIHTDASIYLAKLSPAKTLLWSNPPGRFVWLQVLSGEVNLNQIPLQAGDGVAVSESLAMNFESSGECELMLFDLG